ncbi:f-box domain-containing [Pyrenophora seminiperda CCB06]|uniref:F-box domain-containing n=1 Tax=Pyrenophora seminiperda CCB06 TaxID=1302712 RepID=A0A3M7M2Z7_9PLEO|nr:f-box domain-containing [Pyrenophora seminiperda CCB06]
MVEHNMTMAKLLSKLRYKSRSTKKRYDLLESPTKEVTTPEVDLHMGGIINFFSTMSQTEILEYCLGFDKQGAPKLAEHIILVALKYRTLDDEPYPLLEVGLHFIHRCDAKNELDNPGPHSLNILRQISYRHMIMEDNAHHANRLPDPREIEINHFGATRFVSVGDAKDILEQIFRTPPAIYSPTGRKSYLACPCPIVMLNYDTPQWPALEKAFEIDPFIAYNIVATINTKCIACEPGNPWSSDTITLSKLTQELKIEYPAQQSASDQAAYAIIDAIQLVMRPKVPLAIESIRSVYVESIATAG